MPCASVTPDVDHLARGAGHAAALDRPWIAAEHHSGSGRHGISGLSISVSSGHEQLMVGGQEVRIDPAVVAVRVVVASDGCTVDIVGLEVNLMPSDAAGVPTTLNVDRVDISWRRGRCRGVFRKHEALFIRATTRSDSVVLCSHQLWSQADVMHPQSHLSFVLLNDPIEKCSTSHVG